jgi:hypothetical protein
MNLILIVLCGVMMGAFNFGFFCLGYYVKSKQPADDGVKLTKDNADFIEEMMKWRQYGGDQ